MRASLRSLLFAGGLAASLVVLSSGNEARAQENSPSDATIQLDGKEPPPPYAMSPEMWLYMHEQRRADDPQLAVRRKAEFRADQRARRIAAMDWHGFSNSRPQASVTPFMGTYSPYWSGNTYDPYRWSGGGYPMISAGAYPYLRY